MQYIGCQYAKTASPENLWVKYFTSSNPVAEYRSVHGEPMVIKILKTFKTPEDALLYETRILKRLNASSSVTFLNLSNGNTGFIMTDETRQKISDSLTGVLHTDERKKNISSALSGRTWSEEHKKNFSKSRTGKTTKRKGLLVVSPSEETKDKIRNSKIGKVTAYNRETLERVVVSCDIFKTDRHLYWSLREYKNITGIHLQP